MTKTLSKILAVVLSVCMLFAVPVMASAEEAAKFAVSGSLYAVEGNWETDYAETIVIKVEGDFWSFNEEASCAVYVGAVDEANLYMDVNFEECAWVLSTEGEFFLYVPFGNYVNHAATYTFFFEEGAFVTEDGAVSEELTVTVTGNDIIEALEVEHISVKPIEKLIDWMYTWGAEGFWLDIIDFVVSILNWFLYI